MSSRLCSCERDVTDGNLVTVQAWPDHPEWVAQFLDLIGTEMSYGEPVAAND